MSLGKTLRKHREAKGYAQSAMSKILGVSASSYIRWENDECMPFKKTLAKLTAYFDVDENEFFQFVDGFSAKKEVVKAQPVSNMIATLKRNKEKLLSELHGDSKPIMKVKEKVTFNIDRAIESLNKLMVLEELFFD